MDFAFNFIDSNSIVPFVINGMRVPGKAQKGTTNEIRSIIRSHTLLEIPTNEKNIFDMPVKYAIENTESGNLHHS